MSDAYVIYFINGPCHLWFQREKKSCHVGIREYSDKNLGTQCAHFTDLAYSESMSYTFGQYIIKCQYIGQIRIWVYSDQKVID